MSQPAYAAYIGIDWSDRKHDIYLYDSSTGEVEESVISSQPDAIQAWVAGLRKQYGSALLAVCLEQKRGPLIYALCQYENLVLYPINPRTVANYRKAFQPSRAKSDPMDARILVELLQKHPEKIPAWRPESAQMRALRQWVASRRMLVGEKVRLTNRIIAAWVAALPGAGEHLAPRLLDALGEDRSRFDNAQQMMCYFGIAPVKESSGQKNWVHWRWSCPIFLRQTFVQWANQSRHHCAWAQAYYQIQRAKGNSHPAAMRSLAFKWIRILFRCWKNREAYDEAQYIAALQRKKSPIAELLGTQSIAT